MKQTTIPALKPPSPHRYFSIKNEKLQAVDELKRQQEFAKVTGTPIPPTPLLKQQAEINGVPTTFDRFANYYFEKFHKRKVCEETYRVTLSNYKNHVLPHFGDIPLNSITADKCQELLNRLIAENKVRTEENVFSMLNMLFKAAVKHTVMKHNPMDMVFHTKHEREHGKALTKDEEQLLLSSTAGTPYKKMFCNRSLHRAAPQRIQDGRYSRRFYNRQQQQEKERQKGVKEDSNNAYACTLS